MKKRAEKKADRVLREAARLRDAGDAEGAVSLLSNLLAEHPDCGPALLVLGSVYWEGGRLAEAVASFGEAVSLMPNNELASRGLFHALWDAGRENEALAEMRRFISVADSVHYRKVINELGKGRVFNEGDVARRGAGRE